MRKISSIIAICVLLTLLSGCNKADYVENQAYAVMFGVDGDEKGVELTVQLPKLTGDTGGDKGYLITSASGKNFQEALESMRLATPRELNLSELSLIVVSEQLATSGMLPEVIDGLVSNYRLFSSSNIAVCEGSAKEFVSAQEAVIGTRLSEAILALIANSEDLGYIPHARLATLYYDSVSVYSDPMVTFCALSDGGSGGDVQPGDTSPGEISAESDNKNIYMGAALMREGSMTGKLTGLEMLTINLIKGEIEGFSYSSEAISAIITVRGAPSVKIDSSGDKLAISIKLYLSVLPVSKDISTENIAASLKRDIMNVIEICRAAGTEPFGFAERAAAGFLTMDSWLEYDWHARFMEAEIDVEMDLVVVDS